MAHFSINITRHALLWVGLGLGQGLRLILTLKDATHLYDALGSDAKGCHTCQTNSVTTL